MSTEIRAQNSLALTSVKAIKDATDKSAALLTEMEQAAEDAGTTLTGIYQDAEDAQTSANLARQSASIAFRQLGFVEDIVGVLSLVAKHGQYAPATEDTVLADRWYFKKSSDNTYEVVSNPASVYHLTDDTSVDDSKTYYTRTGTGTAEDPYVYTAVETPTQADLPNYYEKYYVLVGIDEAIENYVSSHLVLLDDGLWLQASDNASKIQISTAVGDEGVIIYDADNQPIAKYGSKAVIGNSAGFHIEIDGQKIGFFRGNTEVAYMNGTELYVETSLAFGNFTFIQRDNGHFTLKLIRSN